MDSESPLSSCHPLKHKRTKDLGLTATVQIITGEEAKFQKFQKASPSHRASYLNSSPQAPNLVFCSMYDPTTPGILKRRHIFQ